MKLRFFGLGYYRNVFEQYFRFIRVKGIVIQKVGAQRVTDRLPSGQLADHGTDRLVARRGWPRSAACCQRHQAVTAFVDVSCELLSVPVGGRTRDSTGNFRRASVSPAPLPARPRCDCAVTSALRGGIPEHPGIPTILKRHPLRPNWTELNWRLAGSTPVSSYHLFLDLRALRVTRDAPAKIYLDNGVLLRNLPGGVAGDLAGFDAAAADSLAAM